MMLRVSYAKDDIFVLSNDRTCMLDLAFFTHFSATLSDLNLGLWGKERELLNIRASLRLSTVLKESLKDKNLKNFPATRKHFLLLNKNY